MASSSSSSNPIKAFQVIYPAYINSKLNKNEGRRVGKQFCAENPTAQEIYQCAISLGFTAIVEPDRVYPRDPTNRNGRVRIQIKDGTKKHIPKSEFDQSQHPPMNGELPNKDAVLKKIGAMIPTLKSRIEASKPKPKAAEAKGATKDAGGKKGKKGRK
eukprot:NODE_9776_length_626_cov_120.699801_g9508_i0.p1 GENE.NODE_9776_length_626_cov_120.699801_g9508_i0~~NODE_9776_length_626_cov_120.699801_g9508_i0.p1  ORF type:complete len:158 (-),score=29.56 NODE_9776_length_626_cov_120.699801_g9508_i0:67-540(-)